MAEVWDERIELIHDSNARFENYLVDYQGRVDLFMYNLGYLPGGDKSITTDSATTLKSLSSALELLAVGGLLCVVCYPGHEEGARESQAVEAFFAAEVEAGKVTTH